MTATLERAGFWRRVAASLLNFLIILVPLQILTAVLFQVSHGEVQGSFGLNISRCGLANPLSEAMLKALTPPPPENFTYTKLCDDSFFGWTTARTLLIGRQVVTKQPNGITVTTDKWVAYALGPDNKTVAAVRLDLWATLLAIGTVVAQWAARGGAFGDRLLGVRLVPIEAPNAIGLGWWPALRRMVLWVVCGLIGALPVLIAFLLAVDAAGASFVVLLVISILTMIGVWMWMLVDIVRRRDPIYDRWGKTAAVLT